MHSLSKSSPHAKGKRLRNKSKRITKRIHAQPHRDIITKSGQHTLTSDIGRGAANSSTVEAMIFSDATHQSSVTEWK